MLENAKQNYLMIIMTELSIQYTMIMKLRFRSMFMKLLSKINPCHAWFGKIEGRKTTYLLSLESAPHPSPSPNMVSFLLFFMISDWQVEAVYILANRGAYSQKILFVIFVPVLCG
jgi:hypothetical protein